MKVFTEQGDRETQRQKDRDIRTPAADSHCYIAETSTLQSNYPPMPDFKHGDTHTQRNRETKRYREIETERQGKTETEIKTERVRGTQRVSRGDSSHCSTHQLHSAPTASARASSGQMASLAVLLVARCCSNEEFSKFTLHSKGVLRGTFNL